MRIRKAIRYIADCSKGFWNKKDCLDHEANCRCWTNQANKTCKTCVFAHYEHYEPDTGAGGYFECNHKNFDEHKGAPNNIDYISVHCIYHETITDRHTKES